MDLWDIIEELKHAFEEKDWDLVSKIIDRLEDIHQDSENDLNEYFQDEEY
jgi:hypothetical protein